MIAISKDSPSDSRAFAQRYGIWFPLIADEDLEISKKWVGVNTEGFAIPGVFLLKRGGVIALREIGERKDDRIYAAELVERLDSLLGSKPQERVALRGGFGPGDKWQLRAALGGGGSRAAGNNDFAAALGLAALYPISRYALLGAASSLVWSGDSLWSLGAAIKLRSPKYADLIEPYLTIPIGLAVRLEDRAAVDRVGLHAAARVGLQFAVWPSAAPFVDLGVSTSRFGAASGDPVTDVGIVLRLGISWMP